MKIIKLVFFFLRDLRVKGKEPPLIGVFLEAIGILPELVGQLTMNSAGES